MDWFFSYGFGVALVIIHVAAVISWMAGMFYLPRLFVYHSQVAVGSDASDLFKVMERKLLKFIMNPAMIVTWISALLLATSRQYWDQGWLHAKITLVLAMSGAHGYFSAAVKGFAADKRAKSERHWRWMNEAPTLLMLAILVLVYAKPF